MADPDQFIEDLQSDLKFFGLRLGGGGGGGGFFPTQTLETHAHTQLISG